MKAEDIIRCQHKWEQCV